MDVPLLWLHMKKALLLICIGFLAFISCSKVEESPWENVEISDFFYVDFSDEDELGLKMDSVYVINDNTKIQQIANNLSFLNERLQNFDSNNGTVLITASKQDYNQFKYDAKIMLNHSSNMGCIMIDYVLDNPQSLGEPYCRVNVFVIPKISSRFKFYIKQGVQPASRMPFLESTTSRMASAPMDCQHSRKSCERGTVLCSFLN